MIRKFGEGLSTRRETQGELNGSYGPDKHKPLIGEFIHNDQVQIWPKRSSRKVQIGIFELYALILRKNANLSALEKARERKAKKEEQRKARQIADADRRMRKAARQHES